MGTIRKVAVAAVVAVLMATPGTGFASSRAHSQGGAGYVGTVGGSRAFVAIVVRDGHITAYVCDSKRIARWFKGTARGGRATLTSGGFVLRVKIGPRRTSGSVRFPGNAGLAHGFTADRDAGAAGLYRGVKRLAGKRYLGGWIILPDGRQRGEVVSGSSDVASPTLNPNDPTVDVKRGKKRPLIIIIAILIG
jgi:hypothetical protein